MENVYWKLIEDAKWSSDNDHNRINNEFKDLGYDMFTKLRIFVDAKMLMLDIKFKKDVYTLSRISADGWVDLRAEVVSRGKEFFEKITLDILLKMITEYDYRECFLYSFND